MDHEEMLAGYQTGIEAFNRGDFFQAHEVWEDIWRECDDESRSYYQGLIQVAVCLYHFGRGNARGARKLCISCRKYLDPYGPAYLGVDLERLVSELNACCADLLADGGSAPADAEMDPSLVPEIHMTP